MGRSPVLLAGKKRSGLNGISHPDWVKFSVELNSAPKQNTGFFSSLHIHNNQFFKQDFLCFIFLKDLVEVEFLDTCDNMIYVLKMNFHANLFKINGFETPPDSPFYLSLSFSSPHSLFDSLIEICRISTRIF